MTLTAKVTCVATGTAICGSINSVAGGTNFTPTSATIAAGAGNQLVYSLPVRFAASLTAEQVTNTATASDPAAAGVASGSDTNVLKLPGTLTKPIPAANRRALLLLTCVIVLLAWWRARHVIAISKAPLATFLTAAMAQPAGLRLGTSAPRVAALSSFVSNDTLRGCGLSLQGPNSHILQALPLVGKA